jgi:hypothetical protein
MAFAYTGSTSIASYSQIGDAATYYALAYAARSDTSTWSTDTFIGSGST